MKAILKRFSFIGLFLLLSVPAWANGTSNCGTTLTNGLGMTCSFAGSVTLSAGVSYRLQIASDSTTLRLAGSSCIGCGTTSADASAADFLLNYGWSGGLSAANSMIGLCANSSTGSGATLATAACGTKSTGSTSYELEIPAIAFVP